jgi:hypothetical protein
MKDLGTADYQQGYYDGVSACRVIVTETMDKFSWTGALLVVMKKIDALLSPPPAI